MNNDVCMGGVTLRTLLENKELLAMPARAKIAEKDEKDTCNAFCDAAAAFLGPNLWDKTLSDFKLEYVDLDGILGSNVTEELHLKMAENTPPSCAENPSHLIQLTSPTSTSLEGMPPHNQVLPYVQHPMPQQSEQPFAQNMSPSSSPQRVPSTSSCELSDDPMQLSYPRDQKFPHEELAMAALPIKDKYNPCVLPLQEEVLKPQPMVRKSQKHFVPDNLKDDKYWARRRKNNLAAKRSREARRVKENQIVLRASFLEKENNTLKDEVLRLKAENDMLKTQLKKVKH